MDPKTNIKSVFTSSKVQREALTKIAEPSSAVYQEKLQAAIATLDECRRIADRLALFSPNETQDDIASGDLRYLLIDYYLAELELKRNLLDRKITLNRAQQAYERYLTLLDTYSILSTPDKKLFNRFLDNKNGFSLSPSSDATKRRETKIARLKQEKQLQLKFEQLDKEPSTLQNDDAALRDLCIAEIQLYVHHTFFALDLIAQELKILALAPLTPPSDPVDLEFDHRQRDGRRNDTYSDRLDYSLPRQLNRGRAGPILSKEGKPLQPFTLLGNRQRLQDGVFRPGHSLPTMTIDEYLEEEKRRGGIIEGGGEQSGMPAESDEDNVEKADIETLKAREWDEFIEENPKGGGNTLNRG